MILKTDDSKFFILFRCPQYTIQKMVTRLLPRKISGEATCKPEAWRLTWAVKLAHKSKSLLVQSLDCAAYFAGFLQVCSLICGLASQGLVWYQIFARSGQNLAAYPNSMTVANTTWTQQRFTRENNSKKGQDQSLHLVQKCSLRWTLILRAPDTSWVKDHVLSFTLQNAASY